jgi:hypothetical protein
MCLREYIEKIFKLVVQIQHLVPKFQCRKRTQVRGRDVHCWTPPAQIRTSPIRASGSYLGGVGEAPLGRLPHAVQRLGHARPALGPVRTLLVRVPPGPRPWLHRLRRRDPGFVRRLHSYYGGVRLLLIVHRRLRLLTFPPRTIWPRGPMADQEISRFPYKERARMPGSTTTPGRPSARVGAPEHVAFRYTDSVGARD